METTSKKWPTHLIITFFEAYEQYPCLWNNKIVDYKDRNKRDEALRAIVDMMSDLVPNFDINSAKNKIRSLRNAYALEHNRVLKSHKSGASLDDLYKPTLGWYSVADRILSGVVETRETKSIMESQKYQNIKNTKIESMMTYDDNDNPNYQGSIEETFKNSHYTPSPTALHKRIKNASTKSASKKAKVDYATEVLSTHQEIAKKAEKIQDITDEFDIFGKVVAVHLRKLPLQDALESQSEILNYLVQKRLGRSSFLSPSDPSPPGFSSASST